MILAEIGHNYDTKWTPMSSGTTNNAFIRDFFRRPGFCTSAGRVAIDLVCRHLGLKANDEVFITTTFGAHYVSSVVTSPIFNYCKISKVLTEQTRLIYIIHEFGVAHPETQKLARSARNLGIASLEDCAYSVDSFFDSGKRVGSYGDYVIYSLPKVFAIPLGGILIGDVPSRSYKKTAMEEERLRMIEFSIASNFASLHEISKKRRSNWGILRDSLDGIGIKPYFVLPSNTSPYCFPCVVPGLSEEAVESVRGAGYEAFMWRGGDIVVLPVHQGLKRMDLDRMVAAVGAVLH